LVFQVASFPQVSHQNPVRNSPLPVTWHTPRPSQSAPQQSPFNIHINNTFPAYPHSCKLLLLFRSSHQNFLCISILSHSCRRPSPYHPLPFDDEYKLWMPLLCQFQKDIFPIRSIFIELYAKCASQRLLSQSCQKKSIPITTTMKIINKCKT